MKIENMFYIHEKDWHELQAWAKLAHDEDKNEISGLMTAIPDKDGRFKLSNVEILKQENSGASTELDAESVAEYKMRYAMKYKNKHMKYVWWHSHHTMSAFWSGTDLKEIDAWKNSSFSLALVINLKEEYKFRVSIWNANGLSLEEHIDTSLEITRGAKPKITSKMKTLYKELCEDDKPMHYNYIAGRGFNYSGHQTNLLSNNSIDLPNYRRMHKAIETLIDSFMGDEIKYNKFRKELDKLNKECIDKKYDYTINVPNVSKNEVIDVLQYTMPEEFFVYKDSNLKIVYEQDHDWAQGWYH